MHWLVDNVVDAREGQTGYAIDFTDVHVGRPIVMNLLLLAMKAAV